MKDFSTRDALEELSDSKEVADSAIIRMIYAYYANYVHWSGPEFSLGFDQMRDIYEQSQELLGSFQSFCQFAVKTTAPNQKPNQREIVAEFVSTLPPQKQKLWHSIYPVRY